MSKRLLSILMMLLFSTAVSAQELLAEVSINAQQIQNVDKKIFQSLETSLSEFINNRRWTKDTYQAHERINCKFNITINSASDNVYSGTLNISASRPVFGTNYESPIFTYREQKDDFTFMYDLGMPFVFDENRVNAGEPLSANLTAVLAYYINIILGLHYDSFSPLGGSEYFRKAQYIVQNAPSHQSIAGWENRNSISRRGRFVLIEQFLNPRFEKFRPNWYNYHRQGLDLMKDSLSTAQNNILAVIPELHQLFKENPSAFIFQVYFITKSQEYINILSQIPADKRKDYVEMLCVMDVPNAAKYRNIK